MDEKESIPVLLGSNVRKYRKEARLTQEQLAEQLKISQKHLSIIETGTQFASAGLIEKLAETLKVSPAELFGGASSPSPVTSNAGQICSIIVNMLNPRLSAIERKLESIEQLLNER